MGISKIHLKEQAVVLTLNSIGWNMTWSGGGFDHYDAEGFTQTGNPCIIEMKFRNKYYETKMLEVYKYNKLMEMNEDIIKIYLVSDPKGIFLFHLDFIEIPEIEEKYCPSTTLWAGGSKNKEVYLLDENQAILINKLK